MGCFMLRTSDISSHVEKKGLGECCLKRPYTSTVDDIWASATSEGARSVRINVDLKKSEQKLS